MGSGVRREREKGGRDTALGVEVLCLVWDPGVAEAWSLTGRGAWGEAGDLTGPPPPCSYEFRTQDGWQMKPGPRDLLKAELAPSDLSPHPHRFLFFFFFFPKNVLEMWWAEEKAVGAGVPQNMVLSQQGPSSGETMGYWGDVFRSWGSFHHQPASHQSPGQPPTPAR